MYFKSSVTEMPPFGVPLGVMSVLNCAAESAAQKLEPPSVSAARSLSFWRIWVGVRLEEGMSKYSSWCLKSYTSTYISTRFKDQRHKGGGGGD